MPANSSGKWLPIPWVSISSGALSNQRMVYKYGKNVDIDTLTVPEDIWNGGDLYTGQPVGGSAETFEIFSSSANDTAAGTGARTIRLFYYNDDLDAFDANGDPLTEDVTMNGLSSVFTTATGRRLDRVKILTAGSGEINDGEITVRHSTTTANVFCVLPAATGHTRVCAYTIPNGWTGYLYQINAELIDSGAQVGELTLWARPENGAVELADPFAVYSSAPTVQTYQGGLKFEEKTDLRIRCTSVSSNNSQIVARFQLVLIKN